jgi:hypothetical protein
MGRVIDGESGGKNGSREDGVAGGRSAQEDGEEDGVGRTRPQAARVDTSFPLGDTSFPLGQGVIARDKMSRALRSLSRAHDVVHCSKQDSTLSLGDDTFESPRADHPIPSQQLVDPNVTSRVAKRGASWQGERGLGPRGHNTEHTTDTTEQTRGHATEQTRGHTTEKMVTETVVSNGSSRVSSGSGAPPSASRKDARSRIESFFFS